MADLIYDALIGKPICRNALIGSISMDLGNGLIKSISTVEASHPIDTVEVVRCKDCGHGKRGVDNIVLCNHPSGKRITMTAYGFCSYGQRREDG